MNYSMQAITYFSHQNRFECEGLNDFPSTHTYRKRDNRSAFQSNDRKINDFILSKWHITYENSACKPTDQSNMYTNIVHQACVHCTIYINLCIPYNVALVHTTVVTYCCTNKIMIILFTYLTHFWNWIFRALKKETRQQQPNEMPESNKICVCAWKSVNSLVFVSKAIYYAHSYTLIWIWKTHAHRISTIL